MDTENREPDKAEGGNVPSPSNPRILGSSCSSADSHSYDQPFPRVPASPRPRVDPYPRVDSLSSVHATCLDILIRILLCEEIPRAKRDEVVCLLHSYQQERTGMFVDPDVAALELDERTWSYISAEMTHLCLAVLSELDAPVRFPLRVMKPIGNRPDAIRNWMSQIRWMVPRRGNLTDVAEWTGNEVLHFGGMLIKAAENGDASWEAVNAMMDCLDADMDARTGLWGTNRGCSKENAIIAAGAIARLYFYLNRPLKFPVCISESVRGALEAMSTGTSSFISDPGTESPLLAWLRCVDSALAGGIPCRLRGKAPFNCFSADLVSGSCQRISVSD